MFHQRRTNFQSRSLPPPQIRGQISLDQILDPLLGVLQAPVWWRHDGMGLLQAWPQPLPVSWYHERVMGLQPTNGKWKPRNQQTHFCHAVAQPKMVRSSSEPLWLRPVKTLRVKILRVLVEWTLIFGERLKTSSLRKSWVVIRRHTVLHSRVGRSILTGGVRLERLDVRRERHGARAAEEAAIAVVAMDDRHQGRVETLLYWGVLATRSVAATRTRNA